MHKDSAIVCLFIYLFMFAMLGIKLRALYMLGKCFTTELHPQPLEFAIVWAWNVSQSPTCYRLGPQPKVFLGNGGTLNSEKLIHWRCALEWNRGTLMPFCLSFCFTDTMS
jgi:hypothetical protein